MRIISGKFRGRVIQMPKGIRPTSDKVREALFEILKYRIEGTRLLDLYCGSGAIGIEALSRGAEGITFVDNSFKCISLLERNLAMLPETKTKGDRLEIYKLDALKALEKFERSGELFDIVFLDPPYYGEIAKNTLIALSNYDILTRNAIIIAETYKKEDLPEEIGLIKKTRISRYGDTKLEFYKK